MNNSDLDNSVNELIENIFTLIGKTKNIKLYDGERDTLLSSLINSRSIEMLDEDNEYGLPSGTIMITSCIDQCYNRNYLGIALRGDNSIQLRHDIAEDVLDDPKGFHEEPYTLYDIERAEIKVKSNGVEISSGATGTTFELGSDYNVNKSYNTLKSVRKGYKPIKTDFVKSDTFKNDFINSIAKVNKAAANLKSSKAL